MRLSVFGLGYVGCVSAACFAKEGHDVIGVDVNAQKVGIINAGNSPIVENGIGELMQEVVASRKLRATTNSAEGVLESDISLVCVGTPSNANGSLDLRYITRVCEEIGAALKTKAERHVVIVRSTMLPGTIENTVIPALEKYSGKNVGKDFGVCINPEFLREGTSLKDFYAPPFTLIGADDDETYQRDDDRNGDHQLQHGEASAAMPARSSGSVSSNVRHAHTPTPAGIIRRSGC